MIDFPAGSLAVGRVTKTDDTDINDECIFPVGELIFDLYEGQKNVLTGRNSILKMMRDGCANSDGLPITVQVCMKQCKVMI